MLDAADVGDARWAILSGDIGKGDAGLAETLGFLHGDVAFFFPFESIGEEVGVDVFADAALEFLVGGVVVGGVDAAKPGGFAPGDGFVDMELGVDGHFGGW